MKLSNFTNSTLVRSQVSNQQTNKDIKEKLRQLDTQSVSPNTPQFSSIVSSKKVVNAMDITTHEHSNTGISWEDLNKQIVAKANDPNTVAPKKADRALLYLGENHVTEFVNDISSSAATGIYKDLRTSERPELTLLGRIYSVLYDDEWNDTNRQEYSNSLLQLDASLNELSGRLQSGEKVDMYSLKTKITIANTDISLGQLLDIQKASNQLISIDTSSSNTLDYDKTAKLQISRITTEAFGNSLGGELGERFKSAIGKVLYVKEQSINNYITGSKDPVRNEYSQTANANTRDIFSKVDISSAQSTKSGLQNAFEQVKNAIVSYMPGESNYAKEYIDSINKHMQSLFNVLNA